MSKTPGNPYAQAAGMYGDNAQKNTPDQRELEARVLLKSARMMKDLQTNWDSVNTEVIEATLKYNRQIWMMFYDTAVENTEGSRPNDLRSNIINLANFIFKREMDIMSASKDRTPDQFNALININREIAAGLMGSAEAKKLENEVAKEEAQAEQQQQTTMSGSITEA